MNKIKQVVTEVLGLKWDDELNRSEVFIFSDTKVYIGGFGTGLTFNDDLYACSLVEIVANTDLIKKLPFEPKTGDKYWCVDVVDGEIFNTTYYGDNVDLKFKKLGLIARTKEEAKEILAEKTKLLEDNV